MVFGVFLRVASVAVATVAAGVYWLYKHLGEEKGEDSSHSTKDEFVLNPLSSTSPKKPHTPLPNKKWTPPSLPQRIDQVEPTLAQEPAQEDFTTSDDPEIIPEQVVERQIGKYYLEELQFPDGSLQVRVHKSAESDPIALRVPAEKVNTYYEKADQLTEGCEAIPQGGGYCYKYLAGLDITDYYIYDAEGNIQDEGGVLGRALTYKEYSSDSWPRSEMVEGGFLFIRH